MWIVGNIDFQFLLQKARYSWKIQKRSRNHSWNIWRSPVLRVSQGFSWIEKAWNDFESQNSFENHESPENWGNLPQAEAEKSGNKNFKEGSIFVERDGCFQEKPGLDNRHYVHQTSWRFRVPCGNSRHLQSFRACLEDLQRVLLKLYKKILFFW